MSAKKRLMFFDFITHYGGAQKSTVLLCSRLKKLFDINIVDAYGYCEPYISALNAFGLPAHVLTHRKTDVVIGHNSSPLLRLATLLKHFPHLLFLTKKLNATIHLLKPDLIWTNNIKSFFFLCACSYYTNAKLGFYAHGWYQKKQIPFWQRILIRSYADVIFAVSNPTKKAMESWGIDGRKIAVVYAAIDFDRFAEKAVQKSDDHEEKYKKSFKIFVPGSLLYAKGQHTVIGAVKLLKDQHPDLNISVWLAGDTGVGDTSGYVNYLKIQIKNFGMEENVNFMGWREDIPELMCRADVVVLPSHTEGLPLVIQEAIILKRPIITTNVGGIPDLISEGVTGHVVDIEDKTALANKFRVMLKYQDHSERMVDLAYNRYITLFNSESQIKRFYHSVEKTFVAKNV